MSMVCRFSQGTVEEFRRKCQPGVGKLCFEMKMTIVISKILLVKSSETIFLPVFHLIMCLMKALKNF